MQKVGFIGIGDMGMGMAKNLLTSGFNLTAYDIREEALKEISQAGAQVATCPRDVGEKSDTVFIMVLNGAQVKEVVFGAQGLLEGIKSGYQGDVFDIEPGLKTKMLREAAQMRREWKARSCYSR